MSHTRVQSASNTGSSTSPAAAFGSNNTAGNLLAAIIQQMGAVGAVTSVTDTQGNTWSKAPGGVSSNATSNQRTEVWYAPNCAAGANTVTATIPVSDQWAITVVEVSGLPATGMLVMSGGVNNQSGTALASGNLPDCEQEAYMIGGATARWSSGQDINVFDGTFSEIAAGLHGRQYHVSDKILSANGIYAWQATASVADDYAAAGAIFFAKTNQHARPNADITNTGTGGFGSIDESNLDPTDFWYGDNNVAEELEVALTNPTDPAVSTGHRFYYSIAKVNAGVLDGGGNAVTITARLMQGTTQIATDTAKTCTGMWTAYEYVLSGTEANAITDYTDLRLEFVTSASGGSPGVRRGGAISYAILIVPAIIATPTTATLTLTAFAPTVTVGGGGTTVTPGVINLVLSTFAPTVSTPRLVTPPKLSLVLAAFVPTIATPRLVTPTTIVLSLSTFAPTVSTPRLVTPTTTALTLSTFAPTVTVSADKIVTPGVLALSLSTFAPTVTTPRLVTPGTVALSLTTFAPTINVGVRVTPTTASLSLTTFAPIVSTPRLVTSPVLALSLTTFAPTVATLQVVTPTTAALLLTTFAPTVSTPRLAIPSTRVLVLSAFAPTVIIPQVFVPSTLGLVLTTFAPTVTVNPSGLVIVPTTATLTLSTFAPDVYTASFILEYKPIIIVNHNQRLVLTPAPNNRIIIPTDTE